MFDVFCRFGRHCGQSSQVSCPQCQITWHFNTVGDARGFGQTHANECGFATLDGAVREHFHCVYDETPAPEAWGPPDVIAEAVAEWEVMVARATSEKARASRRKMADRERKALELSAEALEAQHPSLSVDRRNGKVSIR